VRDAAAISAYEKYPHQTKILITDDASRFRGVTEHQALCWIHAGRHYKVLNPVIYRHRKLLEEFREEFWQYYRRLIEYKKAPDTEKAKELSSDFDALFSRRTCYEALNERIKITLAHKKELLLVLKFPHIPLHNNRAENGARIQARKRDISFQTRNAKGTKAKDTIMTIVETAKKLGVNIFDYIYDRMSNKYKMTSLADLIRQRPMILSRC